MASIFLLDGKVMKSGLVLKQIERETQVNLKYFQRIKNVNCMCLCIVWAGPHGKYFRCM